MSAEFSVEPDVDTTCDAFLGGAVMLRQPAKGYRAGLDAVLLAAAVPAAVPVRLRGTGARSAAREMPRLLDVGAGVGTVGLCAAVRLAHLDVTLLEQSAVLCRLARSNIETNGFNGRARVIERDVAERMPPHAELADNSFDFVVSNPPYYDASDHRRSPDALKAASHAMPDAGLDHWLRFMARMVRAGGVALMVHRADQLTALLQAFATRFGAITVLPLHPRAGEAASRVIVRGIKGSRAPLRIAPGICLHGEGNRFTPEVDAVLKQPLPLAFAMDRPQGRQK